MLEARDLRVRYPGGLLALDGVSLMAHPGDAVAVVGPTGSGKSTLLRVVIGLVPAQAGAVRFNGEALTGLPPHRRAARGIAYVAEGAPVLPGLSVRENLAVGGWLRRDRSKIAGDLEEMLAIYPELHGQLRRKADALSAADRQLLAIARGVLSRPRLLLLDEPSLGLAPLVVKQIFDVIREVNERQKTPVLLVEQNAHHALRLAHRGYVMQTGRITLSGTGPELLADPEVQAAYLEGGRH